MSIDHNELRPATKEVQQHEVERGSSSRLNLLNLQEGKVISAEKPDEP